jgi:hypothetical protein
MLTLDEIETAIRQLPEHSIRELTHRLSNYLEDEWDQQLESDLASGKLDNLIANAEKAIAANQVKELDEILYNS